MPLICPRCVVPMTEEHAQTANGPPVSVDVCGQCKGLWLDAQKLAAVCPTVADLPARKTEIMLIGEAGQNIPVCPRCNAIPYEFAIMEDMCVDFCPQCSGVWLDGDEYEDGVLEPNGAPSQRSRERSPYRSAGDQAERQREVTCQDCARPVTVATSYMWEHGFICRACFGVKDQRARARRVSDYEDSVGRLLGDVLSWILPAFDPKRHV